MKDSLFINMEIMYNMYYIVIDKCLVVFKELIGCNSLKIKEKYWRWKEES